jgi:hypothetical protein
MNNPPHYSPRWSRSAVGADADQDGLILVRATGRGGHLSFDTILPASVSSNETVAACLLQRESFIKWLTVPLASVRKAERVFASQLDVQLPFSVEDCTFALVATQPTADRSGTRGLLAGARNSDIEKRLGELQTAGVNPHVLDQESLALWSQCVREWPTGQGVRILVHLGVNRTTLVTGQGDELVSAHSLRHADPDQIIRLLKSTFPAPPADSQWMWTGPLAADADVVRKQQADLADRWPGTLKVARDPKTFLARALASRALTSSPCRCNLRAGPFTHPLFAKRQSQIPYRTAAALLAAGLVLIAVNLAWQFKFHRQMDRTQEQLHRLAVDITGSPRLVPRGQELLSSRRALETQSHQLEPFLAATDKPLAELLRSVLLIGQEEGLAFETVTLTRQALMIHGLSPKWDQCERAVNRLKPLGTNVKAERKDTPPGEARQAFVISMGWSHER